MMAAEVQDCGFADVMLSYMYDEMAAGERERFEGHLPGCTACTDEFAVIAVARFSVYEWQKGEFAKLPTPEIVIPYGDLLDIEKVGLFDSIAVWAASWRWAFAASLVVMLGLAVVTANYLSRPEIVTVSGIDTPVPMKPHTAAVNEDLPKIDPEVIAKEPVKGSPVLASQRAPIRHSVNRAPVKALQATKKQRAIGDTTFAVNNVQTNNIGKAPVLSVDEYAEDNSLHLSDLFEAELGADR